MSEKLSEIKPKIVAVLRKHGITKAGIFGSYATGKQNKSSDIDILIDVNGLNFSLFDLVGLEQELEEEIGMKVDLLTYNSLNRLLKKRILAEEIRVI